MRFLWILAGCIPSLILYLVYRSRKKMNSKTKLFKDFWVTAGTWGAAGVAAFIISFFPDAVIDPCMLFFAGGFITNFIGEIVIMDSDRNKKNK